MTFGGWTAPSEEDLAANSDFTVLPEDEYLAKVTSIEVKKDQPNKYPSKNDNEPLHDMLVLKAEALTFADGEPLEDENGDLLEEGETVPFQVWLNPKKRGMVPQPAKTRKAFAAILGQALGDPINIDSFDDLVGKTFIVSLKPSGGYNNAQDFRAVKRARSRGTTAKGPVDGTDLMAAATRIFDEDAPDNVTDVSAPVTEVQTADAGVTKRGRGKAKTEPVEDDLDF